MRSIPRTRDAPRLALGALAFALAAASALGCREPLAAPIAAASPDDAPPRRGGVVRFASFADVRHLDPAVASEAFGGSLIAQILAGLVDYDAHGDVVPDAASHWDLSADGRTYRFFLREGVRFHDGDELTADDVKRSVERALHPSTPSPLASFYDNIDGFADFAGQKSEHLAGVTVEGRYVVAFTLKKPDATFLPLLAQYTLRPVCKSAGTRYDPSWAPCGAGPFKLPPGGWERGRSLTLVRHDGYFRPGLPYLDGQTFTFVMPMGTQRFKFEAGDLDAIMDLTQADYRAFFTDARWRPYGTFETEKEVWGENMNVEMAPFDNVEVRRAVSAILDRNKYRLLKAGTVSEASQLIPRDVPLHDPTFVGQVYAPEAALEHMRRAGLPFDPVTKTGGYPYAIPYYVYAQGFGEFAAQILAQELAKIGLRIDIRVVNYPAFLAITHRRGRAPFSPQGWQQDYPDPSDFFEALFHSRSIADEDSNNTSFYKNPRLDALLDRAHSELDKATRGALFREANQIVCDDAPWAFTHHVRRYEVRHPYLRGYAMHPVWSHYAVPAWLDRDPRTHARTHAAKPIGSAALGAIFGGRR